MKLASQKLKRWSNISESIGIIVLAFAFFMCVFSNSWWGLFFMFGIGFILLSPVLEGLSVMVQNAEEQIREREIFTIAD